MFVCCFHGDSGWQTDLQCWWWTLVPWSGLQRVSELLWASGLAPSSPSSQGAPSDCSTGGGAKQQSHFTTTYLIIVTLCPSLRFSPEDLRFNWRVKDEDDEEERKKQEAAKRDECHLENLPTVRTGGVERGGIITSFVSITTNHEPITLWSLLTADQ